MKLWHLILFALAVGLFIFFYETHIRPMHIQ